MRDTRYRGLAGGYVSQRVGARALERILKKVSMSVCCALRPDESSALSDIMGEKFSELSTVVF